MKVWLFAGNFYYPNGGWKDFVGTFSCPEYALENVKRFYIKKHWDWFQLVKAESIDKEILIEGLCSILADKGDNK